MLVDTSIADADEIQTFAVDSARHAIESDACVSAYTSAKTNC